MKLFLLVIVVLFGSARFAFAQELVWKQETLAFELGPIYDCEGPSAECVSHNEGYVLRSVYGPKLYYTLQETVRTYLSFFDSPMISDNPNIWEQQTQIMTQQSTDTTFEWGGVVDGDQFRPLYAVKQIYDPTFDYSYDQPDRSKSGFLIWRVQVNGMKTHCPLGVQNTIEKARKVVEEHSKNPVCS